MARELAQSDVDDRLTATLVRFATRVIVALYSLLVLVIAVSFGAGVFLTRTDERLTGMATSVERIEGTLLGDVAQRLRFLEALVGKGTLPETDKRLEALEDEIRRLHPRKPVP